MLLYIPLNVLTVPKCNIEHFVMVVVLTYNVHSLYRSIFLTTSFVFFVCLLCWYLLYIVRIILSHLVVSLSIEHILIYTCMLGPIQANLSLNI